jgi:hypothetical protein
MWLQGGSGSPQLLDFIIDECCGKNISFLAGAASKCGILRDLVDERAQLLWGVFHQF